MLVIVLLFIVVMIGKNIIDKNRVIGKFYGSEYEFIDISGVTYEADYNNNYSATDKDRVLGKVISEVAKADPMYIWSVKGTDEYIYALWGYDGTFFKRR